VVAKLETEANAVGHKADSMFGGAQYSIALSPCQLRRWSEGEAAVELRHKSNVRGGCLPSLTLSVEGEADYAIHTAGDEVG
jgi:hypothetical protein